MYIKVYYRILKVNINVKMTVKRLHNRSLFYLQYNYKSKNLHKVGDFIAILCKTWYYICVICKDK